MSKLYIVGIGPGSREYLTLKAIKAVESSDMVIGSPRALDLFDDVEVDQRELGTENMKTMLEFAVSRVREGKSVSLLSTGDPGFSGVLKPVLKLSGDIELEVIPGISSVQMCASKLQIPWDDADLVTLHGKGISNDILKVLDNGRPTIILPDFKVNELANYLLKEGVDPGRRVAVCEKLSYSDEKVMTITLKDILDYEFSYMCVMVVY
ncbi:MAG TPA: precorrin-6y C5,15-methyltransferase (decarboxylating) subunit CbiE [Methanobacterium sp.]